jgi:hypothetical protein
LRHLNRLTEALAIQEALHGEASGQPDGYVCEELAECLYALTQTEEAQGFFAQAYRALSADESFVENFSECRQRLQELGRVG